MLQLFLDNFNFIAIGIMVFATGLLGLLVFLNNHKSATNQVFFLLSLITILYTIVNYMSSQFTDRSIVLMFLRLTIFSAVWYAFTLFHFFYIFPKTEARLPKIYKFLLAPIIVATSILTLTPLVFSGIKNDIIIGQVASTERGPGMAVFGLVSVGLVIASVFLLFKKMFRASGVEKKQLKIILAGTIISYVLIIAFNLILPVVFQNTRFILLVPLFLFPSIVFTAYAIIRHQLFNIKIIATELLVFTIWIVILIELLTKNSWGERVLESSIFLFMVIFGILLIKSVRQEVNKREQFELLSKELAAANAKLKELDDLKTDFISIASHQLRTPLTAIKGYSSMIMEGTYGESPIKIKGAVDKIFQSAQRLIYIVNDLLDISRIEQGRLQMTFEDVKAANVLRDVVEELRPNAQKNNIDLSFSVAVDDAEIKVKADFSKIRQVFLNIIDNAIKYTPSGFVKVEFKNNGDNALISVSDSGVGMTETTIKNLFQKFSRAKGIAKMHTDGSGLGLYVAKEIVAAHGGRVWAESDGEGKGSRFFVELPIG